MGDCRSVHFADVECAATTASGVLGLVGYHPQAELGLVGQHSQAEKENQNNNIRMTHRRRKKHSSNSGSTDESSATNMISPTNSQTKSQVTGMTRATKRPLGITSMSKLNSPNSISFLTPQKEKSDKLVLYDAERMTRT